MHTPWYMNAVVYSLDVRLFQDSDGDGIGDFDGLTGRLDYLSALGVTAVWLLPFFPTPYRDGGYDVTEYCDVDERLGGMDAFVRFARAADESGLRVIVDLPLNHTSRDHRWFQEARRDPSSPYRDYYVWADEPPADPPEQIVFRGEKRRPWTFDDEAGQYYLHRFYEDEPDLNHGNPRVQDELLRVMEFWLNLGASGIRVDAAPYIAEKSAGEHGDGGPHPFLAEMHRTVAAVRPDAMLLAEADVHPAALSSYFGEGTEVQVLFAFLLNNYFFLALAREAAEPLIQVLGLLPRRPRGGQWANWVRNHDELDLERLSTPEREDVMAAFAPEEDMQVYGRGIRRRFPPMVDGDRRRMELAYSLLLALPGMPVIRYGEEIGMGDDLSRPERDSVRTPMQWAPVASAGFSTADPRDLLAPVITGGDFGYGRVNVADQQLERDSFLARMHTLVAVRRQHPQIGLEEPEVIETGDAAVLGLAYRGGGELTIIMHNLAGDARKVRPEALERYDHRFDILADTRYEAGWEVELRPYGYRWSIASTPTGRISR